MRNNFIKIIFLTFALSRIGNAYSQHYIKPSIPINEPSFAVFVDNDTYNSCKEQIMNYKQTLESENLPTFVVYKEWNSPEEVKNEIKALHQNKKLEGIVFIGKIPIPMIQKAQHMTSAFKKDEKTDRFESSVPSDRFYDSFNLKFNFVQQDSVRNQFFYYDLAANSPQQLKCDIYSARIKPILKGEEGYAQINDYLKKVIVEHKTQNNLNQFVSYTGDGSYSNSLMAWVPESHNIREQFSNVFEHSGRARFLRYNMWDYPKEEIFNQLKRDDLDFMIFHEHGMPDRQYISGIPYTHEFDEHIISMKDYLRELARRTANSKKSVNALMEEYQKKYGIDSTWFAGYDSPQIIINDSLLDIRRGLVLTDVSKVNPNVRFVIFDACYNGDFRENDFIAGRYIFSKGKCIVTFANSVNVLQDKQANDLLGLLGYGARIGQWAKYINILESHIIGDPTFRFTSNNLSIDACTLIQKKQSDSELLNWLSQDTPCDIQNLALYKLYNRQYKDISNLLTRMFRSSSYAMVRYTCLDLLEKLDDENYREVLKDAATDTYEFIRRIAINRMSLVGLPEYLPYMINTYLNDNLAERVKFNIQMGLRVFPKDKVEAVLDSCITRSFVLNKEQLKQEILKSVSFGGFDEDIMNKEGKERNRLFGISTLKNINNHPSIEKYIKIIVDPSESLAIRKAMLQSLAWFDLSYKKDKIIDACQRIINSTNVNPEIKEEAVRTYNRLKK